MTIPGYDAFVKVEPLNKGWSSDKKYVAETADGRRLLLRVTDIAEYGKKKTEFEMIQKIAALGIPMQQPLDFGVCDDVKKVFQLLSWVEGEEAAISLPMLTQTEQNMFGLKSGKILEKLHSIPAPEKLPEWASRYFEVMDKRLMGFLGSDGFRFDGDKGILQYLAQNRSLLKNRPQSFRHGDYSIWNTIITAAGTPVIIDWEADDFGNFGDPWLDFVDVIWSASISPNFASGIIYGYFDGNPPEAFWPAVMYYTFMGVMISIQAISKSRPGEVRREIDYCKMALGWFDHMQTPVPTWYQGCSAPPTAP